MDRLQTIVGKSPSELSEADFIKRLKNLRDWEERALASPWPKKPKNPSQSYVLQKDLKSLFKEEGLTEEEVLEWLKNF